MLLIVDFVLIMFGRMGVALMLDMERGCVDNGGIASKYWSIGVVLDYGNT